MASHIIGSRNRVAQLSVTLGKLDCEAMRRRGIEPVLVDSASNDAAFEEVRLEREFRGAADYLKHQLDCS
jgi:hypothetical protein